MLDEKMKVLQEEKDKVISLLNLYPDLYRVAEKYDYKVLNKRVVEGIKSEFNALHPDSKLLVNYKKDQYISQQHSLAVWEQHYGIDYFLMNTHHCEDTNIVINRRFCFSRFKEVCTYQENYYKTQLERLISEISSGLDNLQRYNDLIAQANEIAGGFSNRFKEIFKYNFKKGVL